MQVLQASLEYNAYSHNFQSALPTFYMPNILISFCRQNSILLSILCCFVEWPVKYSPFFKLLPLLSVGEVLDGIQTAEGFLLQTCYSPNYQNLYYQYPIIWNDIVTKRIFFFHQLFSIIIWRWSWRFSSENLFSLLPPQWPYAQTKPCLCLQQFRIHSPQKYKSKSFTSIQIIIPGKTEKQS